MKRQAINILAGLLLVVISLGNLAEWARQAPSPLDEVSLATEESIFPQESSSATSASLRISMHQPAAIIDDDADLDEEDGQIPTHISIPAIGVNARILSVSRVQRSVQGETYEQWQTPKNEVGWHDTSALIGKPGNSVFNGHHNMYARVFENLINLRPGDIIRIEAGGRIHTYKVDTVLLFSERFRPIEERLEHARWLLPTPDERITLVTCWPPSTNTHRVIVVAFPVR